MPDPVQPLNYHNGDELNVVRENGVIRITAPKYGFAQAAAHLVSSFRFWILILFSTLLFSAQWIAVFFYQLFKTGKIHLIDFGTTWLVLSYAAWIILLTIFSSGDNTIELELFDDRLVRNVPRLFGNRRVITYRRERIAGVLVKRDAILLQLAYESRFKPAISKVSIVGSRRPEELKHIATVIENWLTMR